MVVLFIKTIPLLVGKIINLINIYSYFSNLKSALIFQLNSQSIKDKFFIVVLQIKLIVFSILLYSLHLTLKKPIIKEVRQSGKA